MNNFNRNRGNSSFNASRSVKNKADTNSVSSSMPEKISREQLDNLANSAGKQLNTSPEELKKAAQTGNLKQVFSQLTPSQAQQLQKILSDENAAKKLLATPQAQAILRGLNKNE